VVPPGERGYLVCRLDDSEAVRFFVSPGERWESYVADRIEYHYTSEEQTVAFEITREDWAQAWFAWMESEGMVMADVILAQAN
jgi:hypothetical protein